MSGVRIDKFLWSVRLFKTRSLATEACKKGKVSVDGQKVKASKEVNQDQCIIISKGAVNYSYKVLQLLENRVGAKLVAEYIEDITPQEELDKIETIRLSKITYSSNKGQGRPTKKDRRLLDDWYYGE